MEVRLGDLVAAGAVVEARRGVEGLLAGFCEARLSSSAKRSCSDCGGCCFAGEGVGLVGLDVGVELLSSTPRSSNWARSSSFVGAVFFVAIAGAVKRVLWYKPFERASDVLVSS